MDLNVELIRKSFQAIKPYAAEVTEHFYDELFRRHPEAKELFKSAAMAKQRMALAESLSFMVDNLTNPVQLSEYLAKLGQRHVKYRVEPAHYDWVGEALLATFAYYLEGYWTKELEGQWVAVYTFAADKMKEAMASVRSAEAPVAAVRQEKAKESEVVWGPQLQNVARELAAQLLAQALQTEVNGKFGQTAKQRVRDLLFSAMEDEIRVLRDQLKSQIGDRKKDAA